MENKPFSASQCQNLPEFLRKAGALIQKTMEAQIPLREPRKYLYDLMQDYPARGGKKFRSALVLLACEYFGGKIEDALNSAIAFELFQNFALIHDDIEDGSLIRRGKPTLHRLVGIPLALNAGDCLQGIVFETLIANEERLGAALTFKVMRHFSDVMRYTFEGQAIDIGWVTYDIFPSRDEYQMMITRKTGWYSGKGPCQCGAMIGGATSEQMDWIGRFGEAIGIGFQARDDVLNLITDTADEAPTANTGGYGKERGGDIAEGKRTLITIEMFERLSQREAEKLHRILMKSREETTEEEIEWSIRQAETCGAIDAVTDYCAQQAKYAQQCLSNLPDHPVRGLMEELIQFLTIQRIT
ncbi:polyprenyl synthetase family protein [Deltaproteobacteria bacterium TL4]